MKFIIQVVAILFLAHLLALFLPWYCIAPASFVMGYMLKSRANFLAGFVAIAILWTFNAWLSDQSSTSDLADRVTAMFALKHKYFLYVIMASIGGLVGGLSALTGSLLRKGEEHA